MTHPYAEWIHAIADGGHLTREAAELHVKALRSL